MCKESTNCELRDRVNELGNEMTDVKSRLATVETEMGSMRNETREGMKRINSSVENLAHDFGSRMTVMESRIVTEKERWGETLRWTVKVSVRVLCALALAAGGVTVCRLFFAN